MYSVNRILHIGLILMLTLSPLTASAQNHIRRAMDRAREKQNEMARRQVQAEGGAQQEGRSYLRMHVENGDTTYLDNLPPTFIFSRGIRQNTKN